MILFLKPYFAITPWAGKELNKIYDCNEQTGEAWIVSGYKNKSSVVTNGIYKGQSLRHLWRKHPELFGDYPDKEFPILIKLISADQKLSVQVHPNDDYALKTHNELGKFECWYILPGNQAKGVTLGVSAKTSLELQEMIQSDTLENYLINKEISQDDLVVVEPGRVHALHGGSFVLEVQEASDLTYRLYDYHRLPERKLHIEDALNVIDYQNDKNLIHHFKEQDTFKNSHFNLYKLFIDGKEEYENKGFEIFYVIAGEGTINQEPIKKGDAFLLTQESEKIIFEGQLEIISVIPKPKTKERMRMRKVAFITGVIGQDGYYLTKLLLKKNYEVHGLIQAVSAYAASNLYEFSDHPNFITHIGDMTDTSNLNRILENIKPDEIYHLASQSHVDLSFVMPEYTTQVNALGTLRLLDAIKNSEIRTKLFHLSSPYLFSGESYPQDEHTPFEPNSPYAISKLYAHKMVEAYRKNFNLFVVNGICFNHESPLRDTSFVSMKIIDMVKRVKMGKKQVLALGNLNAKREWGFAQDYAYAMWLLLQQDTPQDYVISTGKAYSIREFATKAYAHIGIPLIWQGEGVNEVGIHRDTKEVFVKVDPRLLRPNDAKVLVGNSQKLFHDTNFKFEYDLDQLIDVMLGVDETC